jgi:hypothetical protein
MKAKVGDWTTEVEMTAQEAQEICKLGQMGECCAFLGIGSNGFECLRMTDVSVHILDRLEKGTMNAKGRGGWEGCYWKGKI